MAMKFSRSAGFLIAEALIGLLIGALLMAVFTVSVFYATRSIAVARQRVQACMLAGSAIEDAFAGFGGSGSVATDSSESCFSVRVTLDRDASIKRLVRATARVTWPQGTLFMRTGRCI